MKGRDAVSLHGFPDTARCARRLAAGVRRLVSCDTIPHPTNAIRVAPLIAAALRRPS